MYHSSLPAVTFLFHRRADIYPGFPGSREFEWEYAVSGLDAINPAYF